jgi:hypothetical protein
LAYALEPRRQHFPRRRFGFCLQNNLVPGLRQAVIQSAAPAEQARDFQAAGGVRLLGGFERMMTGCRRKMSVSRSTEKRKKTKHATRRRKIPKIESRSARREDGLANPTPASSSFFA